MRRQDGKRSHLTRLQPVGGEFNGNEENHTQIPIPASLNLRKESNTPAQTANVGHICALQLVAGFNAAPASLEAFSAFSA